MIRASPLPRRPLSLVPVLLVLATPSLAAQQQGRVVNADGRPLAAATVEVWGRGVVHHVTSTDGDGRFTVPRLEGAEITRYIFRHLGLGVEIVQAEDFHDGMVVELTEEPAYELEGLTATVSRDVCPRDDEPVARELWAAAAARYHGRTSRRGIRGSWRSEARDVNELRLFEDIEKDLGGGFSLSKSWHAGERLVDGRVLVLEEVVPSVGYAWDRAFDHPEYFLGRDRHLNWKYAELDTRSANHFATATFGAMHDFALVREDESGVRIGFCPTREARRHPSIQGTLLVGHDRSLLEAEWRFETDDPVEDAGGWVRFATAEDPDGGPPHLVAERGVFYRHSGFEKPFPDMPRWLFRELRAWTGWTVSRTADPPSARSATGGSDPKDSPRRPTPRP